MISVKMVGTHEDVLLLNSLLCSVLGPYGLFKNNLLFKSRLVTERSRSIAVLFLGLMAQKNVDPLILWCSKARWSLSGAEG